MLIENDMILAFYKKSDHLKPIAERVFSKIKEGELGEVIVSSVFSIELYYVLREIVEMRKIRDILSHIILTPNLRVVPSTIEQQMAALFLLDTYRFSSIFDAMYAAAALSEENPDHTIISTDTVYDRVEGLKRVDPADL